jgi:acyl carrier protein
MQEQTEQEKELAELLVQSLSLEDVKPSDISPEDPLFGDGLGLDSIDALELALAVSQDYGLQIKADDSNVQEIFYSLRSLAAFVAENKA